MIVEVVYGVLSPEEAAKRIGGYAFRTSENLSIGDLADDCGQTVTVVKIGSTYQGQMRTLGRKIPVVVKPESNPYDAAVESHGEILQRLGPGDGQQFLVATYRRNTRTIEVRAFDSLRQCRTQVSSWMRDPDTLAVILLSKDRREVVEARGNAGTVGYLMRSLAYN